MNYYNEHDPKAAAWLRELIKQGHIPDGFVDTRSIVDVRGDDLAGYVQCHFFAGIGGWPRALQLAGWPADRPVWTGSCPCQPFSCAGKGKGTADERHLWPEFARLIGECRPATVFGEQVASRAGREWLSGVFADLEGMGYAAAGADLCAASVGAPHIRQRLFWVADSNNARRPRAGSRLHGAQWAAEQLVCGGASVWLPNSKCSERRSKLRTDERDGKDAGRHEAASRAGACSENGGAESIGRAGRAHDDDGGRRECAPGRAGAGGGWMRVVHACECDEDGNCPICGIDYGDCPCPGPTQDDEYEYRDGANGLEARRLLHASEQRSQGFAGDGDHGHEPGRIDAEQGGSTATAGVTGDGFWDSWQPLHFRDGKTRRTKPGLFCLAHGVSNRVVRLRGYGNAIEPHTAAEFIQAAESARLLTDAEVAALAWDFPTDWREYERIEQAHNALCDAGRLINKPLD